MVNFSPVAGHEQDGARPALVVSRNELNRTGLCMVVPGTRTFRKRPGRVAVPKGEGGLPNDTYLLCDQLRTVDPVRCMRRIGAVDPKYVKQTLALLHYFLSYKE
jgi:mRNA interferase MazF